ncbi:citrate lyase acyl carrier protein [Marinifilum breve]|jgi:citrate lyase subunit gamma (acyl carrier protein)|uniref:Citrate lyase subunit gamma (Acyl carrier protein) n=2 Tax=Marinifilum TaxID=866673 RepID=A0A419X4E4_9BACT|nr:MULTISPECIES: citrate lyase acyl carrier protein [Marinifilum]MCY1634015.1 citrate lyase acyl carrier protein [Marinifilum sp. D737]MDQ2177351.1 citrate lyase acyl carrier protein [Marinifilum sp. D714]PXY01138.1 citrate lyase acyl carrier protein [Marinifilum breve]RKE02480.1 citrate lyase subunit gamma (acyl carrier protein) [Marinifilum flexuosum]
MTPKFKAQAGTFESSDIMVLIEPVSEEAGRQIDISSTVMLQFEDDIKNTINQVLDDLDIQNVHLIAKDKGALTPTIKARVEAAVKRSLGIQEGTM